MYIFRHSFNFSDDYEDNYNGATTTEDDSTADTDPYCYQIVGCEG